MLFRLRVIKSQMSNHIADWVVNIPIFNHKRSLEIGALITRDYQPGYYTSCSDGASQSRQYEDILHIFVKLKVKRSILSHAIAIIFKHKF